MSDENLRIIKTLTHLLPSDWASKAESGLRIFGADRALLLVEGIAGAPEAETRVSGQRLDMASGRKRHHQGASGTPT